MAFTADPGSTFSRHAAPAERRLRDRRHAPRAPRTPSPGASRSRRWTPLHRDATCAADNKIVSGELKITTSTRRGPRPWTSSSIPAARIRPSASSRDRPLLTGWVPQVAHPRGLPRGCLLSGRRGAPFRHASPPRPVLVFRPGGRVRPGRGPPRRHGAVRLRRRPAEHQSPLHGASARPTGAALRAAHHAGPLRQRDDRHPLPGPALELVGGRPPAHPVPLRRAPLARRRPDHGPGRRLDPDAGPRPGHRLSPAGRPGALDRAAATDDTTLVLDFAAAQPDFPTSSPTSRSCRHTCWTPSRGTGSGRRRGRNTRSATARSASCATSQPPLGLRAEPRFPGGAGRPAAARAAGDRGGGRADDQARGAHLGRTRLRRDPAGPRRVRRPRPAARGARLPAAVHHRHRVQRAPPAVRPAARRARRPRPRPAGAGGGIRLRVRYAGLWAGAAGTGSTVPHIGVPRDRRRRP